MALYQKNIGSAHQAVRLMLAIGVVMAGFVWLSGIVAWVIAAAGIGLALTGIVGWCPACAAVGIGKEPES